MILDTFHKSERMSITRLGIQDGVRVLVVDCLSFCSRQTMSYALLKLLEWWKQGRRVFRLLVFCIGIEMFLPNLKRNFSIFCKN